MDADELAANRAKIEDIESNTKHYLRVLSKGRIRRTGVTYYGDMKQIGDAWVQHGYGELKVSGEMVYDGNFKDGRMHGEGTYLFENGDEWKGGFWNNFPHGCGTLEKNSGERRDAIYFHGTRVCWDDELQLGRRIHLKDPLHNRHPYGTIIGVGKKRGKYLVKLDHGHGELVYNLADEEFSLVRHEARSVEITSVIDQSLAISDRYDYDQDQRERKTSHGGENYYHDRDVRAEKKEAERAAQRLQNREAWHRRRQLMKAEKAAKVKKEQEAKELEDALAEQRAKEEAEREEQREYEESLEKARAEAEAEWERKQEILKRVSSQKDLMQA